MKISYKKRGFLLVLLAIILIKVAYGDSVSIDPTSLRYDNVLRGGYALHDVIVKTDSKSDIKVNFGASGDIASWISISSKGSTFLNSNSPVILSIAVRPPQSVSNGEHQGSVVISFDDTASSKISSGGINDFVLPVSVYVTDQIVQDVKINNVLLDDVISLEPLLLTFDLKNNGNVNAKPTLRVDIKDSQGKLVKSLKMDSDTYILPTQEQKLTFNLGTLGLGDYMANINLFLGDFLLKSVSSRFSIVSDKSQLKKIVFSELESRDQGHVNNPFNLVAHVRNNGEGTSVRFSGQLYYEGNFLSDIESDFVLVDSQQSIPIKFGFTPTKLGDYKIVGHLETPNLVRTPDRESAFEIITADKALSQIPLSSNPILAIVLMVLAIFIFVRINKTRTKKIKKASKKRR